MNVTEDRKELFKAIAAAQGEFTTVEKNATNPHFKSKFAPLDSIIEMIRPVLPKHGLSVLQFNDIPESGDGVIIETIITHESGQYISGKLRMPVSKNDPQGYGSSITYGRRYALGAALGIVSDEDVDGNQSASPERYQKAAAKQEETIDRSALAQCQVDLLNILGTTYMGNGDEMADALRNLSSFIGKDGNEKYLTMANLEHPATSEKLLSWIVSTLKKANKELAK